MGKILINSNTKEGNAHFDYNNIHAVKLVDKSGLEHIFSIICNDAITINIGQDMADVEIRFTTFEQYANFV